MLTAIISILLLIVSVALLPIIAKLFLYGLATVVLAIRFAARKIYEALPWVIAAGLAIGFTFYAFGRQFFCNEDAKLLIAERLPPRDNFRERTLSLLIIELMLEISKRLSAR